MGFLEGLLKTSQTAPTNFFGNLSKGMDAGRKLTQETLQEQMRNATNQNDWRSMQQILESAPDWFTADRDTAVDAQIIEQMQLKEIVDLPETQLTGQNRIAQAVLGAGSPQAGEVSIERGPTERRVGLTPQRVPGDTSTPPKTYFPEHTVSARLRDDYEKETRRDASGQEYEVPVFGEDYTEAEAREAYLRANEALMAPLENIYSPNALSRAEPYLEERFTKEAEAESRRLTTDIYERNRQMRLSKEDRRKEEKASIERARHQTLEAEENRKEAKARQDAEVHAEKMHKVDYDQWVDLRDKIDKDAVVKQFRLTQVNYKAVMLMVGNMIKNQSFTNVGPEQIAVFNLFQRTIDPATVREGDIALQRSSMGMLESAKIYFQNITEGQVFNEKFALSIVRAMTNLYEIQQRGAKDYLDGVLAAGSQKIGGADGRPLIHPDVIRAVRVGNPHLAETASEATNGASDKYRAEMMPQTDWPEFARDRNVLEHMASELKAHQTQFPGTTPPSWGKSKVDLYHHLVQKFNAKNEQPPASGEGPGVLGNIYNKAAGAIGDVLR
tara:strand:- start:6147 stop:7811 length:1665 start_codon:yes stop_codon:yes gene_type:complete